MSPKKSLPIPASVWRNPLHFIAFGFGSGAFPYAPGTIGTLVAIPFYWMLHFLPLMSYISIVCLLTLISIWLCDRVSKEIQVHDHPGMNVDEFIGYFVTMIAAPPGFFWIVTGFILFRIFDIAKPWPIRWIDQKVGGGLGIILDDIVAGLASFFALQLLARILL